MSITVRLWTDEELMKAYTGEDLKLSTVLMNGHTFSEQEMRHYPYHLRKTYEAVWMQEGKEDEEPVEEFVTIHAPSDEMVLWFIQQDYTRLPDMLYEVITKYRRILPVEEVL